MKNNNQSKVKLILPILVVATLGTALILQTFAGGKAANFELENVTVSGADVIADNQASGNSFIQFGSSTPPVGAECAPTSSNEVGWRGAGISESSLTKMSGQVRLNSGAVLENFDIDGFIYITGDNVTVRNGRVKYAPGLPDSGVIHLDGSGAVIENVEIDGSAFSQNGIFSNPNNNTTGYTAKNIDIYNTKADGIKVHDNVVVDRAYIHDHAGATNPAGHNDGIQSVGNSRSLKLTVTCSTIDWGIPDGYGPEDVTVGTQLGRVAGGQGVWMSGSPIESVIFRDTSIISIGSVFGTSPTKDLVLCNVKLASDMGWAYHGNWNLVSNNPSNYAWDVTDFYTEATVPPQSTPNASCN